MSAYIENFDSDSLDYCGFHAIEVFEETKGNSQGDSMGDSYMEEKYKDYDRIIMGRIKNVIGLDVWDKFSPKFKMQLWSFMFNSDSGQEDKYRWLAVLANTVNYDSLGGFNEDYTISIINKAGTPEWSQALSDIYNATEFDYEKLLDVLNGQYATYGDKTSYNNSWKYRPNDLDNIYNDCSKTDNNNTNTKKIDKRIIIGGIALVSAVLLYLIFKKK